MSGNDAYFPHGPSAFFCYFNIEFGCFLQIVFTRK